MAEKDTVSKKANETQEMEKRVTRLEAMVRMIKSELKEHFGIDAKDGKSNIGLTFAILMVSGLMAFAVDTVVDWSTGVSGTIGTAKITTDGTNATLTVDKIAAGTMSQSNTTVTGTLSVTGSAAATTTVKSYGYTTIVSTNGSQVIALQMFTPTWPAGATTITQAFDTVFIETPKIVWSYNAAAAPVTNSITVTVASNSATFASPATNFTFFVSGRIK